MCGGTARASRGAVRPRGLSPRVRGNPRLTQWQSYRARSIPACAGEPVIGNGYQQEIPVYPRVCGGTRQCSMPRGCAQGLSPRVRGNHKGADSPAKTGGSIPACAGEPASSAGIRTTPPVYPRVCGGTMESLRTLIYDGGLSPRVRGNPAPLTRWPPGYRSIPACAGEPATECVHAPPFRVYPRVCGGTATETPPPGPG